MGSYCLRREVRKAPRGCIVVSNCNLVIEDINHRQVAEIDGAFIRILRGRVELDIVEAKTGHCSGTIAAMKHLIGTLGKIGASQKEAQKLVRKRKKYAFACIPLAMGRKWSKGRDGRDEAFLSK